MGGGRDTILIVRKPHRTRVVQCVSFERVDTEAPLAASVKQTIQDTAKYYTDGEEADFVAQLADDFAGHGSESGENWVGKQNAMDDHLTTELGHRKQDKQNGEDPVGQLVSLIKTAAPAQGVNLVEDHPYGYFSAVGNLIIRNHATNTVEKFDEASWSAILKNNGSENDGDWKIVFSHFSIHR